MSGVLSNRLVCRTKIGKVDSSIALATINIIRVLVLEIRLVQGIGINRDELASSQSRIILTRN